MTGLFIASNPTALGVQFKLTRSMGELADTLTRLSTGLRINSGKDDPAGLIASELLKSDIVGTTKAITNTQRAGSLVAVADSSMGRIGNLLNDIRGLIVESANTGAMSAGQIEANQLQIDASIDAVDRIARSTTFQGQKLLDGSLDFSTSGVDSGRIKSLDVYSVNFGTDSGKDVTIRVVDEAKKASLQKFGTGVSQATTIDITGSVGSKTFDFGAGTTNREMAAAISALSDSTGVMARVEGGTVRGSTILSSTGANNDILITANDDGYEAGNYSFRIVQGAVNDVKIVSEPSAAKPGVVEISLQNSFEQRFHNVAGLFDVTVDTGYADDAETAPTSIHVTRGDSNGVRFFEQDSMAVAETGDGTSITFGDVEDGHVSAVNGWTLIVDDMTETSVIDMDNKTIRITSETAADEDDIAEILATATGATGTATLVGELSHGDRLTFTGGGDAGELFITYKEGATVGEIQDLINRTPHVHASVIDGVSRKDLVPNLPAGPTYLEGTGENTASRFQSGASAQTVIDLINSKLGDRFTATALGSDGTGGRVSYMNAAVDYGDVDLGNALRFTGTDSSPIIRMVTGGANRELGVSIRYPSESDIASGISRPVLEIQLATDASGSSTSTARDIAELFDRLSAEETLGVSAELLYPPGMDPNGRSWSTDACGNVMVTENCAPDYGRGIVQPTGVQGPCEIQQNDLVMLGRNQKIVEGGYPVATIPSVTAVTGVDAVATDPNDTVNLDFGPTSALNGVSFTFTTTHSNAGFDPTTGRLNVYLDPSILTQTDPELTESLTRVINGQIRQNWTGISGFTHASGDPPTVREITGAEDLLDLVDISGPDAVLTIGGISGGGGGGTPTPATGTTMIHAADGDADITYSIATKTNTEVLNGMTIVLGNQNQVSGGTITVLYDDNATADEIDLETKAEIAINAGLATLGYNVEVKVTMENTTGFTTGIDLSEIQGHFRFTLTGGSSGGGGEEVTPGGVGTDDPALRLVSKEKGTYFSGVNVAFVEDGNVSASQIEVEYDERTRKMTVRGNTGGAGMMDSDVLAGLLNANEVFRKYCDEIDLVRDVTPDTAVGFYVTGDPSGRFVGGYEIVTESDDGGGASSGRFASSSGIGMTGGDNSPERLVLEAVETGSENFVKIYVAQGSFETFDSSNRRSVVETGTDITALVNGLAARGRGDRIDLNTSDLSLSMTLDNRRGETSFRIDGGGALFQLGPNVVSTQQIRVSLGNMGSTHLGGTSGKLYQLKSGGAAAMTADTILADRIILDAIQSVSTTRGRLGALQRNTLEPNIDALQDSLVSLTSAESSISNADFAEESSNMLRYQILIQAGASVLAQANQLPQYAASLVR